MLGSVGGEGCATLSGILASPRTGVQMRRMAVGQRSMQSVQTLASSSCLLGSPSTPAIQVHNLYISPSSYLYMLSEMRVHYCASLLTNPWHCFVRGVRIVSLDVWLKCAHVLWIFFLKSKLLLDIVVIHLLCVDCLISFFVPSGLDRMRRWKNVSGAIVHAWHSQSWATHMFRVGEALSTNSAREFMSA